MSNALYLSAAEAHSGKSAIALGMMRLLLGCVRQPVIFRPIISHTNPEKPDHDINLLRTHFYLTVPYDETYACTFAEARSLINDGQYDVLMDKILRAYKALEQHYDFILCEGTDFEGKDPAFEFDLNADIAANLGCPILLVTNGMGRSIQEAQSTVLSGLDMMQEKGVQVFSVMVNMSTLSQEDIATLLTRLKAPNEAAPSPDSPAPFFFVLPCDSALGNPTMSDVLNWLKATVVYGQDRLETLVEDYLIAAMQVNNFLTYIEDGHLVITPGDRADIVLASLASRQSSAYPNISGILLTGGIELAPSVVRLVDGWSGVPVPILSVQHNTYKTLQILKDLHGRIAATDNRKINAALGHFERSVDTVALASRLVEHKSSRMTPRMFEFQIMEQAKKHKMRIVLPEGEEERVLRAAEILLQRGVADLFLLGDADRIGKRIHNLGLNLDGAHIIQPNLAPYFEDFVQTYHELRQHKGISLDDARDRMNDATYFGTMMVYKDLADGLVSGSVNTTAHTVRPALEFIKTKPGISIVSSVFFMCLKDRVLTFGDCAVNPDPTADQLADIAIAAAETARTFGLEPRVAMLSYSTGKSGKGADVDKVVEATRLAHERAPELLLEGPLQYDAAIDPEVARTKMPGSNVAGRASVFIFPDLNTGNNTYKAVQRAAGAIAIGPVLQGLRRAVNDLSRGCTIPDIVNTVAITAVQAQSEKGLS